MDFSSTSQDGGQGCGVVGGSTLEKFQKASPHSLHVLGLLLLAFDLDSSQNCAFLMNLHPHARQGSKGGGLLSFMLL